MDWLAIAGLILVGTFLVIAEIVFIPGIFIAGTIGVLLSTWGVYISFDVYGTTIGTITLIAALLANISGVVLTFRGKTWKRFSLRDTHTSRVNEGLELKVRKGMIGTTISTLKPIGKAIFEDREYEVSSKGGYIDENQQVMVVHTSSNKIIVEKHN